MFEGPNNDRRDEILDTFTRYKLLLAEYVDKVVFSRTEAARDVSGEDREMIEAYKRAAERENGYENYETHLKAKIFEGILIAHGKEIFGPHADVVPTSEFDDWVNGTDLVLEGTDEKGRVARIGVDAALSADTRNIEKKNGAILGDIERLNVPAKKEPFHLKYFSSAAEGGRPRELRALPRVVLGIDAANFGEVLNDVREGGNGPLRLRKIFLTMIKNQLENQFVLALGVNAEKMDIKKSGSAGKPFSPSVAKKIRDLHPLSEEAVHNGWDEKDVEKLFSAFEENETIFSMKRFSIPEYSALLGNIAAAWEWTRKELLETEAEEVLKGDESGDQWETNDVVRKLESHLDERAALKHRPFLAA